MRAATIWVHASKESCYAEGLKIGLTGEVADYFAYAGTEFKLTFAVDEKTGAATLTHVDDRKLGVKK